MTRDEWQAIDKARHLLHLGEQATLDEIKRAYRQLCKRHHPDVVGEESEVDAAMIRELTLSYTVLMHYCHQFRIPLLPCQNERVDPEDWWMDRFGRDPLWGKKEG